MAEGDAPADADAGLRVRLRQAAPIPLDVEFHCAPGELLALLGPSGAGKSTALRCVAGLARPAEGSVACDGEVWLDTETGTDLPARRRRVGMVFQSYALFPHMTASENVAAAMGHRPAAERAGRARDLLSLVRLAGLEDRRPARLSGGQQQRVAVARALARDPAVLLLDEPYANLDPAAAARLAPLLRGRTRVLTSHDPQAALAEADLVLGLRGGRALFAGAPGEIDPAELYA